MLLCWILFVTLCRGWTRMNNVFRKAGLFFSHKFCSIDIQYIAGTATDQSQATKTKEVHLSIYTLVFVCTHVWCSGVKPIKSAVGSFKCSDTSHFTLKQFYWRFSIFHFDKQLFIKADESCTSRLFALCSSKTVCPSVGCCHVENSALSVSLMTVTDCLDVWKGNLSWVTGHRAKTTSCVCVCGKKQQAVVCSCKFFPHNSPLIIWICKVSLCIY